jgi:hypothetical protein
LHLAADTPSHHPFTFRRDDGRMHEPGEGSVDQSHASLDLPGLVALRHPNSWGSITIDATPGRITASHRTETIDDAIGLMAAALGALLERRAAAEARVATWLPDAIRS